MKKIASIFLSFFVLVATIAPFLFNPNVAFAAAPTGTLTSTAITVNIGEIRPINTLTVTAHATTSDITVANDIFIRIPASVNAIWDISDTTATLTGTAAGSVSPTLFYPDAKTLRIDVTGTFAAGATLTIADLSYIGHSAVTAGVALTWSTSGLTGTYGAAAASTAITVADGIHDTLTGVSVSLANDAASVGGVSYTVNFTVPTGGVIPRDGRIRITFPAGFGVASAGIGTHAGIDGALALSVSGQDIILTRSGGANTLAGARSIVITGITNHATANSNYAITVTTQASTAGELLATALSPAFSVNPAAINNLTCESSGQAGAIWLRWTVPAGVPTAYLVRHALAPIPDITAFEASTATSFTQSWAGGTLGEARQELVIGLNPNTRYHFAMRVGGAGGTFSVISTPAATTCIAPAAAVRPADATPPATLFTAPAPNSTVQTGAVVIRGTARDVGGSSIQRVEITLDGGSTWTPVNVISGDGVSVIWEHTIANASAGTITAQARATDWVGNMEIRGPVLTFRVSPTAVEAPLAPVAPVIGVPPVGEQATAVQIETALQSLRVQLLNLLTQLLAQLQAQLAGMR